MRQKGFILLSVIIIALLIGVLGFFVYQNIQLQKGGSNTVSPSVSPTATLAPTSKPAMTPPVTVVPTSKSTPTPIARSFKEEEILMRRTLAGFEMYIGGRNTAGALSFFTPPQTNSAKKVYEDIRTKNLSFGLTSWSFVMDSNGILSTEETKGGYRVRIYECRTNNSSCPILFLELVRDEKAENYFSIDRYYTTAYSYQNNLGEEIKYQGFGF